MNTRNYSFNPDAAKQSDNVNARITDTGKYIGKFTRAEAIVSKKGTEGIEFSFATDANQSADFLSVWTHDKDGKELMGFKTIQAIMACTKTSKLEPQKAQVEKWKDGAKVKVEATVFPALMNKPIGLLLQKEPYYKQDGSVADKMSLYFAFEAATEMTAGEIVAKATKAEKLGPIVSSLKDRPLQKRDGVASGGTARMDGPPDNFDDSVPFEF